MRKCVGCQEMKPKKELIRVLRNETGAFSPVSYTHLDAEKYCQI